MFMRGIRIKQLAFVCWTLVNRQSRREIKNPDAHREHRGPGRLLQKLPRLAAYVCSTSWIRSLFPGYKKSVVKYPAIPLTIIDLPGVGRLARRCNRLQNLSLDNRNSPQVGKNRLEILVCHVPERLGGHRRKCLPPLSRGEWMVQAWRIQLAINDVGASLVPLCRSMASTRAITRLIKHPWLFQTQERAERKSGPISPTPFSCS
jgi:hypothetical protein